MFGLSPFLRGTVATGTACPPSAIDRRSGIDFQERWPHCGRVTVAAASAALAEKSSRCAKALRKGVLSGGVWEGNWKDVLQAGLPVKLVREGE